MDHEKAANNFLIVAGAVAAVLAALALFQNAHHLGQGVALVVAAAVIGPLVWLWADRRTEQRAAIEQAKDLVRNYETELPITTAHDPDSLAEAVRQAAVYVPLPYSVVALPAGSVLAPDYHPNDPVEYIVDQLRAERSCLLLGDPGTGKSLVSMITFGQLSDLFATGKSSLLPVFLRLNEVRSESAVGVRDLVPAALRDRSPSLVDRAIKNRHIVFILDGLDELPAISGRQVATEYPPELEWVRDFPCLLTCREAFHSLFPGAARVDRNFASETHLVPEEFRAEFASKAEHFIRAYCHARGRENWAGDIVRAVHGNRALDELLTRPLMLRMITDVLIAERESDPVHFKSRTWLIADADYLSAELYDRFISFWIQRDQERLTRPILREDQKLDLLGYLAYGMFGASAGADMAYGAFELQHLAADGSQLAEAAASWARDTKRRTAERLPTREQILLELSDRTLLIVTDKGKSYRFAHKSFFEFLLARHVYRTLCEPKAENAEKGSVLAVPLPDEVIDFLRELLHRSVSQRKRAGERKAIAAGLVAIVEAGDILMRRDASDATMASATLMARQQAANLLPIVASPTQREKMKELAKDRSCHPFIRRAISVGEALHHEDSSLLDIFVTDMDIDVEARSYHMGYNRIYYGDQPLSGNGFRDDGAAKCARFFRASLRHMKVEHYKYIRSMAMASVRYLLEDRDRRELLAATEHASLVELSALTATPSEGDAVYERERLALQLALDSVLCDASVSEAR